MKGAGGVRWYRAIHVAGYPSDFERHCYEATAQRERERRWEPIVVKLPGWRHGCSL